MTASSKTPQDPHRRHPLDVHPGVRLVVSALVAGGAGRAIHTVDLPTRLLAGWAVGGLFFVAWMLLTIAPMGPEATSEHALREEPARIVERIIILLAAVASLAGIAVVLLQGGLAADPIKMSAAFGAIIASWGCIHTLFAVRYARIYYTDPVGGIDFHTEDLPSYSDFTYVGFTVGMSFAVSDTDLETTAMRRTAQTQALLSYLYGTGIVALLVNLVAGLASGPAS